MTTTTIEYADTILGKDFKKINAENYEAVCTELPYCYEHFVGDRPVKLVLDIDYGMAVNNADGCEYDEGATEQLIRIAKDVCNQYLGITDLQYYVATSNSPSFPKFVHTYPIATPVANREIHWKNSARIIVVNYLATRDQQDVLIKLLNKYAKENTDWADYTHEDRNTTKTLFDEGIYTPERKIRSAYASKPDENRPMTIIEGSFNDGVIAAFFADNCYECNIDVPIYAKKVSTNNTTMATMATGISNNKHYLEVEQYILKGCLSSRVGSEKHVEWVNTGIHFLGLFTSDDAFTLWKLLTEKFGTDKKKNDCESKFAALKVKEDDKDKILRTIRNWAKKGNAEEYTIIKNKFDPPIQLIKLQNGKAVIVGAVTVSPAEHQPPTDKYYIHEADLSDPYATSKAIEKTLNETLVFCKENWYMLTSNQLWKQQKTPHFYIANELRKYIDASNLKIVTLIATLGDNDDDKKDLLRARSSQYTSAYISTSKASYLSVLVNYLKPQLTDDTFSKKLDANKGKLAFKNGIMDLKTRVFRNGILWNDFITDTIQYDYIPSGSEFLRSKLLKILNNNEEHLEYFLSILGFSFIGQPDLEKSIYFMIDKTECGKGDNGKTFFFDILSGLMPYYVYRTKATFLEKQNPKVHKQLVMMKGKRLVWVEEMPKDKDTNSDLIKELADGKQMENEIMFGTSETIELMFKVFPISNHVAKIKADEQAVYNRYKQVSFNSHFDRTGERTDEIPEELKFIADPTLATTIKEQYYNEVFNLIIDYAHEYYKREMKLPAIPSQFVKDTKATQASNDKFGKWFDENCELVDGERVALKLLTSASGMSEELVREGMARKGIKYEKDMCKLGKDSFNKYYKGGYTGIKYNDLMEEVC